MTDVRVSSVNVEVIRRVDSTARVGSLNVEVLRSIPTPNPMRVSALNVEVLRSYVAPAPPPSGGGAVICVFSG